MNIFSKLTETKESFIFKSNAQPLLDSKGENKFRVNLLELFSKNIGFKDEKKHMLVAAQDSKFYYKKGKPHVAGWRTVAVKIDPDKLPEEAKGENRGDIYVHLNINSLSKRLGISKSEIKKNEKEGTVHELINRTLDNELPTSQKVIDNLSTNQLTEADDSTKEKLINFIKRNFNYKELKRDLDIINNIGKKKYTEHEKDQAIERLKKHKWWGKSTTSTRVEAGNEIKESAGKKKMNDFFNIYNKWYSPNKNRKQLEEYYVSEDFKKHAESAKVYYNKTEINVEDAKLVVSRREPVNIAMGQHYNKKMLEERFGYKSSVYNDTKAIKSNGEAFRERPNTASVYSEAFLWPEPGVSSNRKEVAILNVPAPALDVKDQPHFKYYVNGSKLDREKYRNEMNHLAKAIVQAVIDNKSSAREGKGLQRLVISRYGQANFLNALRSIDEQEASAANNIFYDTLVNQIVENKNELKDIQIVISEWGNNLNKTMKEKFVEPLKNAGLERVEIINGDIKENVKDGDLIVNAWDPHSAIGNGNDNDDSFDGQIGRSSTAVLAGTPQLNSHLNDSKAYIGV